MNSVQRILALGLIALITTACGHNLNTSPLISTANLTPIDTQSPEDLSVVHGRAFYTVNSEQLSAVQKAFNNIFMSSAFAAYGTTTVTYTNSASTLFTINVNSFSPGTITNNTLSLGSVSLSTLTDNNLKVCGTNGATKCNSAAIRVYTTGSVAGFVNTTDAYGAPVYTGALNPTTPVGLLAAGSVQAQNIAISTSKHTVSVLDFQTPTYSVTSDFSNAGAGSYAMTYVVEYVLLP